MNNREQFEAFLVSEYAWANDALNAADFHGDDATGYYTGGDYIYDGQSCSEGLFWAWRGWQAASKASEQQLAAVVAENAGLKAFGDKLYSMYKGLETSGGGFHDEQSIPYQQAALDAAMSAFDEIETPATDAAIANIQAQGVEMFASSLKVLGPHEHPYSTVAKDFAAQLRQGVAL